MNKTLRFRSILMVPDETGKTKNVSFDAGSIRSHELELTAATLMRSRAWIVYFFLALLIVIPACALAGGAASMFLGHTPGESMIIIIPSAVTVFFPLWILLGYRGALRGLKWDHVISERGKGSWKIIDEQEWESFNRMLVLAGEARKKRPVKKKDDKWLDVKD